MPIFFIAGIDTDAGKSVATGYIARYLKSKGKTVISQKIAQTGCETISDDILTHRQIMNEELSLFDTDGTTCPYVFKMPASPHLSSKLENKVISINTINDCTNRLSEVYEYVLLEGVGGLCVPITENYTSLDFLMEKKYPIILVSSSKLGSINHTLLSLEVIKNKGLELHAVLYNHYPNDNELITNDSKLMIKKYTKQMFPNSGFAELPVVNTNNISEINFDELQLF